MIKNKSDCICGIIPEHPVYVLNSRHRRLLVQSTGNFRWEKGQKLIKLQDVVQERLIIIFSSFGSRRSKRSFPNHDEMLFVIIVLGQNYQLSTIHLRSDFLTLNHNFTKDNFKYSIMIIIIIIILLMSLTIEILYRTYNNGCSENMFNLNHKG